MNCKALIANLFHVACLRKNAFQDKLVLVLKTESATSQ